MTLETQMRMEERSFIAKKRSEARQLFGEWDETAYVGVLTQYVAAGEARGLYMHGAAERAQGVFQTLLSEPTVIPKRLHQVIHHCGTIIDQERQPASGLESMVLVPVGAAVHGGAAVREALGTEPIVKDLDMGTIVKIRKKDPGKIIDTRRPFQEVERLSQHVETALVRSQVLPVNGSTNVLCEENSPSKLVAHWLNPALAVVNVLTMANSDEYVTAEQATLYLHDHYPHSNQREIYLDTLTAVSLYDENLWQRVVAKLMYAWEGQHVLKPKHFDSSPPTQKFADRTDVLFEIYQDLSNQTGLPMKTLLHLIHNVEYSSGMFFSGPMKRMLTKTHFSNHPSNSESINKAYHLLLEIAPKVKTHFEYELRLEYQ